MVIAKTLIKNHAQLGAADCPMKPEIQLESAAEKYVC